MVFADQVFYIHGPPTHLLSVHVANQRLLADRIFLAHAASLRQTSFFARWKFRGFLHSFIHMDDKGCRLRRSTQHYPRRSLKNASPEEPIRSAVFAQNLARAVSWLA